MERRCTNRISAVILSLIVFAGIIYVNIGTVNAETEWELQAPEAAYVGQSWWVGVGAWDENTGEYLEGMITSAESSAPAVITTKMDQWEDADGKKHDEVVLVCKDDGVATITANFTKPDNTTGTVSKTVTVNKYPNQIKSLKVNGKKVKVSKYKYGYQIRKYKKTKASVKLKLKSGWKLNDVYMTVNNTKKDISKDIKVSKTKILKGKSFKFPKGYDSMYINLNMKKGDKYIDYSIEYLRN